MMSLTNNRWDLTNNNSLSQRRGEDAIDHWSEQVKLKTSLGSHSLKE
jgi:hypothetical protein